MESKIFDRTEVYENDIRGLLKKITDICRIKEVPFFSTFCIKNDENGASYKNEVVTPFQNGQSIKDDRISEHIKIERGYKAVKNISEFLGKNESGEDDEYDLFIGAASEEKSGRQIEEDVEDMGDPGYELKDETTCAYYN